VATFENVRYYSFLVRPDTPLLLLFLVPQVRLQSTRLHPVGVVRDQKVNIIIEVDLLGLCPSVPIRYDPEQRLIKRAAGDEFESGTSFIILSCLDEFPKFPRHVERVLKKNFHALRPKNLKREI